MMRQVKVVVRSARDELCEVPLWTSSLLATRCVRGLHVGLGEALLPLQIAGFAVALVAGVAGVLLMRLVKAAGRSARYSRCEVPS
jgi:hypothetical protein